MINEVQDLLQARDEQLRELHVQRRRNEKRDDAWDVLQLYHDENLPGALKAFVEAFKNFKSEKDESRAAAAEFEEFEEYLQNVMAASSIAIRQWDMISWFTFNFNRPALEQAIYDLREYYRREAPSSHGITTLRSRRWAAAVVTATIQNASIELAAMPILAIETRNSR